MSGARHRRRPAGGSVSVVPAELSAAQSALDARLERVFYCQVGEREGGLALLGELSRVPDRPGHGRHSSLPDLRCEALCLGSVTDEEEDPSGIRPSFDTNSPGHQSSIVASVSLGRKLGVAVSSLGEAAALTSTPAMGRSGTGRVESPDAAAGAMVTVDATRGASDGGEALEQPTAMMAKDTRASAHSTTVVGVGPLSTVSWLPRPFGGEDHSGVVRGAPDLSHRVS
jgi:hypothetical protein